MQIETERLLIRDFRSDDWRQMLNYQSDPEFLRFYHWIARTSADVQSLLQVFIGWQNERPRAKYQVAIVLRAENRLIGNVGIRMKEAGAFEAEMGYELDREFWGQGYASEAARAMLRFGFNDLRLHRIWASCVAENRASSAVMERVGMTYEGCLRESDLIKGRWYDLLIYAILVHEWQAQQD